MPYTASELREEAIYFEGRARGCRQEAARYDAIAALRRAEADRLDTELAGVRKIPTPFTDPNLA